MLCTCDSFDLHEDGSDMESKPDYLFLTFNQFVRHVCCRNKATQWDPQSWVGFSRVRSMDT